MDTLLQDLQKTIAAVEALSAKPATASERVDALLDQLFQHKTDLVNAPLHRASPLAGQAASALKQAASQAEQALQDPRRLAEASRAVSDAISKLAKLLDHVLPLV